MGLTGILARAALLAALAVSAAVADVVGGTILEDHSGTRIGGATVRVSKPGPGIVAEAETGQEGRFRMAGLPPGDYRLEISKPNYVTAIARLHADPETPASGAPADDRVIRLVRLGAISGRVYDQNGPIRAAGVVAFAKPARESMPESIAAQAGVDSGGAYRIFGLPPGRYGVCVFGIQSAASFLRGVLSNPREFVVLGGEEYEGVNVFVPPSESYAVDGNVGAREAVGVVSLALVPAAHPALSVAVGLAQPDGGFHWENVLPGDYDLLASGPVSGQPGGQRLFGRTSVAVRGQNVADLRVAMHAAREIAFELHPSVHADRAMPCSLDAVATFSPVEAWLGKPEITAQVAERKPVTVGRLAPARYQVSVKSSGGGCTGTTSRLLDLTQESGPGPVVVPLEPPCRIYGHVESAGEPSELAVALTPMGGKDTPAQIVFTGADGQFSLDDLPPGQYFVTARLAAGTAGVSTPKSRSNRETIELSPGESKSMEFRVRRE